MKPKVGVTVTVKRKRGDKPKLEIVFDMPNVLQKKKKMKPDEVGVDGADQSIRSKPVKYPSHLG